MDDSTLRSSLEVCRERAIAISKKEHCVQHINAVIIKDKSGMPQIAGFTVSDWMDNSTVESYFNGKLC